jgi:hypothetical protein
LLDVKVHLLHTSNPLTAKQNLFIDSSPVDAPILYLSSCSMDKTPEVSRRNAEATFWCVDNQILPVASFFWQK